MVIGFTKLPPDNSHAYSYVATATAADGKAYESNCNVETSTCELTGLTAARAYDVTVLACFVILPHEEICGLPSQLQKTWTRPRSTFYNFKVQIRVVFKSKHRYAFGQHQYDSQYKRRASLRTGIFLEKLKIGGQLLPSEYKLGCIQVSFVKCDCSPLWGFFEPIGFYTGVRFRWNSVLQCIQ